MTPTFKAVRHSWRNGWAVSILSAGLLSPGVFATSAAQAASTGNVCFYKHIDHQGQVLCVNAGSGSLVSGPWNDFVSSVKIQPGFKVELFEHANAAGKAPTLQTSAPNLVKLNFNDMASSYKVTTSTAPTTAPSFMLNGLLFRAVSP